MNIPDHWIVDLHLVNGHVQMALASCADAPEVGSVLVTERYGEWETLEVLRLASTHVGSVLAVRLIEPDPHRA